MIGVLHHIGTAVAGHDDNLGAIVTVLDEVEDHVGLRVAEDEIPPHESIPDLLRELGQLQQQRGRHGGRFG